MQNNSLDAWIAKLLSAPEMLQMGHGQDAASQSLGLGWLYYGLARAMRPRTVVVIGSWRGFVPIVLGRALADNGDGGRVIFIDPSLVDDFWKDPTAVVRHFEDFGLANIEHHCLTTAAFAQSDAFKTLAGVELLFVDGLHTFEQAQADHETFKEKLSAQALVLFHDSLRARVSRIYGGARPYAHRVKDYMSLLRQGGDVDVLDIDVADGLTIVGKRADS
jgi:predicted O-methyltransferase YrrM